MTGLPRYVERGGEIVFAPPGIATGVQMYAWMLEADPDRLAAMFDRYLNRPSGGAVDFEPAGSVVVLNFTTMARIGASAPPDIRRGYFAEAEVAIWVLARNRKTRSYATFIPYMWVDKGSALAMGREVYGFPKQLGQVELPAATEAPPVFRLVADGVESWGPQEEFKPHEIITVSSPVPAVTTFDALESHFATQAELVEGLGRVLGHDRGLLGEGTAAPPDLEDDVLLAARTAQMLADQVLPTVFLKQIRDVAEPLRACYQAVAGAEFTVTGFDGAGELPGDWRVHLADLESEPVRHELGFPEGPITPVGAFWVDFDFTLSVGTELWRAPGPPPNVRVES